MRTLRDIDFSGAPYAVDLINRSGGGEVPRERVRYVDLTGDGGEEAVVVVESGGTMGDIGVGIYRLERGAPELTFFRKLAGRVEVREQAVVLIEGVPAAGDPACCPSQLRETTIAWRDGKFAETGQKVVDNPNGGGR